MLFPLAWTVSFVETGLTALQSFNCECYKLPCFNFAENTKIPESRGKTIKRYR